MASAQVYPGFSIANGSIELTQPAAQPLPANTSEPVAYRLTATGAEGMGRVTRTYSQAPNGSVAVAVSYFDASGAALVEGTFQTIDADQFDQPSGLAAGAATAAKQDTGNAALAVIQAQTAGAATAAKQDTGNAALASIDGKLPALSGGRIPVVTTGVQPALVGSVSPKIVRAQIVAGTLATGVPFESRACSCLVIGFQDVDIQWQRTSEPATHWLTLPAGASYAVTGLSDANEVRVRRKDLAATAVDVFAEALRVA